MVKIETYIEQLTTSNGPNFFANCLEPKSPSCIQYSQWIPQTLSDLPQVKRGTSTWILIIFETLGDQFRSSNDQQDTRTSQNHLIILDLRKPFALYKSISGTPLQNPNCVSLGVEPSWLVALMCVQECVTLSPICSQKTKTEKSKKIQNAQDKCSHMNWL